MEIEMKFKYAIAAILSLGIVGTTASAETVTCPQVNDKDIECFKQAATKTTLGYYYCQGTDTTTGSVFKTVNLDSMPKIISIFAISDKASKVGCVYKVTGLTKTNKLLFKLSRQRTCKALTKDTMNCK
jgi:hypothetical protein